MSEHTWVDDFPQSSRGTYRLKADEEGTEGEKLDLAKKMIQDIAIRKKITILFDAKMQGSRWLLIWWPASEPRHHETDQIIN